LRFAPGARLLTARHVVRCIAERLDSFRGALPLTCRSAAECVRGLPGRLSRLLQFGGVALASQSLQLSRFFLGLLGESALGRTVASRVAAACTRAAATARLTVATGRILAEPLRHGVGHALLPFVLLLQPSSQVAESIACLVHLPRTLRLFAALALYGFVLIAELIAFEFEQVGQVFGIWRLAPATTATALTLAHLDITECGIRTL
jgi:hypothetical protein